MTRQSSRLKAQEKTVQPNYAESDSDMDVEPGPSNRPLKRKREADSPTPANAVAATAKNEATTKDVSRPAKKVRGKRGVLQQLVEMPLDLLFEVRLNHPSEPCNTALTVKS